MSGDPFEFTAFLIFVGAALLATVALYVRQAIIVAYIVAGVLAGPSGADLIGDPVRLEQAGGIGITFLLFLLGMDLAPSKLFKLLNSMVIITGLSALLFGLLGFGFGLLLGYSTLESVVLGVALIFSSTIIGIKLLPTTVLHHKATGEVIISILLLQDVLAIVALFAIQTGGVMEHGAQFFMTLVSLPAVALLSYVLRRIVIDPLLAKFDTIREYVFLLVIGWCLGIAHLAHVLGLTHEMGAFIAGVTLAANPIALFITESLKPVRDFFLIIFFFALGGALDVARAGAALLPAAALAGLVLLIKPLVFRSLLRFSGTEPKRASEVGVRLGQGSEFSLLIGALALENHLIGDDMSALIQTSILLTFVVSCYLIVLRYPTPIAASASLRRG